MSRFAAADESGEEWGGYMGEVSSREVASMSGLAYTPDLAPVGSGAAGTYYPRDTSKDAAALNYLGFFPEQLYRAHIGTSGSQKADQANGTGAWSSDFQQALRYFQEANGLGADGWIGPGTRTVLGAKVAQKNALGGDTGPIPLPPSPFPGPTPGPTPVSTSTSSMGLYLGIGAAALAVVGLGAWAMSD